MLQGAGADHSDLIAGYERSRQRLVDAAPDVVAVFDSHWFTTGYHLADGGARYRGTYISDEGTFTACPTTTAATPVWHTRSRPCRASHKFNPIDWKPNHPRIFHESNVSRPENVESDKGARRRCSSCADTTPFPSTGRTNTATCRGRRLAHTTCKWRVRWAAHNAAPRAMRCRHTRTLAAPATSMSGSTRSARERHEFRDCYPCIACGHARPARLAPPRVAGS